MRNQSQSFQSLQVTKNKHKYTFRSLLLKLVYFVKSLIFRIIMYSKPKSKLCKLYSTYYISIKEFLSKDFSKPFIII